MRYKLSQNSFFRKKSDEVLVCNLQTGAAIWLQDAPFIVQLCEGWSISQICDAVHGEEICEDVRCVAKELVELLLWMVNNFPVSR